MENSSTYTHLSKIKNFYELTQIPVCLCDKTGKPLQFLPVQSVMAVLHDYLPGFIEAVNENTDEARVPVVWISTLGSFNGFVRLDEAVYLVVGPVTESKLKRADILDFYETLVPAGICGQVCSALMNVPHYTYPCFLNALSLITELCTGRYFAPEEILSLTQPLLPFTKQKPLPAVLLDFDKPVCYTEILRYEDGICKAVASGNTEILKKHFSENTLIPFWAPPGIPFMGEKYAFIFLTSIVLRSAILGGIPSSTAFTTGDYYIQQLGSLSSPDELRDLICQMALDFCEKVKKARMGDSYSPIARKCQNYIFEHLHDSIRLDDLAKHCQVTSRSISSHFRKVFHMSVSEYITQERLKEARHLLTHSNYSIAAISLLLKFSSQSYFTRIFRENFGCTPLQYRNGHGQ